MTLNSKRSNVPHLPVTATLEPQISLRSTLRLGMSKLLAIFHFTIGHNVKFQSIFNKFEISKSHRVTIVRTVTWNIKKEFVFNKFETSKSHEVTIMIYMEHFEKVCLTNNHHCIGIAALKFPLP